MDALLAVPQSLPGGWPAYLSAILLVMIRISCLMVTAPIFSSEVIAPRLKVIFVLLVSLLVAPIAAAMPLPSAAHSVPVIGVSLRAVAGEMAAGSLFGLELTLFGEILLFAGQVLGFQFSFSLVNLLDPYAPYQTPLLGQLFSLFGTLILFASGLYRELLMALVRSFRVAPPGAVWVSGENGLTVVARLGGVLLAALELAAPVIAATLLVEVGIAVLGRVAPQLPVMMLSIPIKTLVGYGAMLAGLALWPRFLELHFESLLDAGESLLQQMAVPR
ncbi:flagellar biosynthetic protein FliR [Silvibacterium dinghuense]|uniref:Type III secretion protein n=1 Tax=Silvibacterium dinghuense TaxID=1560006 RepID=A0A4Q1SEF5_9BACT|nr:flagellar biosynthetic protein FliR [Silvibacterium dinghuense]RXS95659.1 type III secretion protein [Silvibacterium dinghuense]GGH14756.1 flagellar biosynthetic protein FliR [Silvibacterium dinghuense]